MYSGDLRLVWSENEVAQDPQRSVLFVREQRK